MRNARVLERVLPLAAALVVAGSLPARAGGTVRVSVGIAGSEPDHGSYAPCLTPDGRFVAFYSAADNLVLADTNGSEDVFLRDVSAGTTERVSVDSAGAEANGASIYPSISSDGRLVVFSSWATNLVPGDTNGAPDVFLRDRLTGQTTLVSQAPGGAAANGSSQFPTISPDGRFLAFESDASNLVSGDTNAAPDVFLLDRQTGALERVSLGPGGSQADGASGRASLTPDGRYVAFWSLADDLVTGDVNAVDDVFVRDRLAGTTELVSVDAQGGSANGPSLLPTISADGRYVAFRSSASDLVAGDTNGFFDAFRRDRLAGTTMRVSVGPGGVQGNSDTDRPAISADGRYVAFDSHASNLVPADANGFRDIFVHDCAGGQTLRASVDASGGDPDFPSDSAAISPDGRFVAFSSGASNLVSGDTNGLYDVFLRELDAFGPGDSCDPGSGGVLACPCANPAGAPGLGCDNSAGTGGAQLVAAGIASLVNDSLGFTTTGERPSATSVVLQGSAFSATGLVFGQGVRCVSGALKRLYVKTAANGSIFAPDAASGDTSVSLRSAALGDPIAAGQSRWYMVYYRDPIVLGGCPAVSTYNATQSGRVDWSP